MLNRLTAILACFVVLISTSVGAGEPEGRVFGGNLTIEQATPIAALLAAPRDHAGKVVRIEGVVTEVCARHGDWIKVAVPRGGSGILVRAGGTGITFPADCATRPISVEGVFEAGGGDPHEGQDAPHVCAAMTREGIRFHLRATGAVVR